MLPNAHFEKKKKKSLMKIAFLLSYKIFMMRRLVFPKVMWTLLNPNTYKSNQ